jgi:hypothetical protein
MSRQAGHRKGDGTRCKGYCFHSGGKLANSKGDGARCNRSFDSRGAPDRFPGPPLLFKLPPLTSVIPVYLSIGLAIILVGSFPLPLFAMGLNRGGPTDGLHIHSPPQYVVQT